MNNHTKLKKYVELFKRYMADFLANDVNIKSIIHPVESEGAVFEFLMSFDSDDSQEIAKPEKTVGHVLEKIPQKMIAGNLREIEFGGTSLYLESNRIVVIKGEDGPDSWSGNGIWKDVRRVVSTSQGGAKNEQ